MCSTFYSAASGVGSLIRRRFVGVPDLPCNLPLVADLFEAQDASPGLYYWITAFLGRKCLCPLSRSSRILTRAARTLMQLGLTYHNDFNFQEARQAYQGGFVLWRQAGEIEPAVLPLAAPHALRLDWGDPPTLNPAISQSPHSSGVITHLFSGLVELSPELDVVPDVARNWEISKGGCRYIFHLRDDVRWSDGTPLTARDFEYAWKRVLDPAVNSPNASLLYDVKGARAFHRGKTGREEVGVQALGKATLSVELEGPTGYFLQLLAYPACYPVPRHVVEAQGEAWTEVGKIVTNGPFKLETWRRGDAMVLARNPEYHGRFRGNVQQVELLVRGEDPFARLKRYEVDDLDVLDLLLTFPPRDIDRARQRHGGEYVLVPALYTAYIGFDVSQPPFDDQRVRRAFALAMDTDMVANVFMRGYAAPATGGFIPPGMPGHSAGIGLPYDPEGARKLLAEAGYPKGHGFPAVNLLHPSWPAGEDLQALWRENLGVEIGWQTMEWATFLDKLDKEPPLAFAFACNAEYPDPDSFLRASSIRRNTRWRNEAYDRLVEKARRVSDQRARMKLYRQADRILVEEAVIVPVGYGRDHFLVKPWVSKFPISAIQRWFWKDVFIEPH
jgi:oligopeptide transport system substrate-binding protein